MNKGDPIHILFLGTGAADWPSEYPPSESTFARGQVRGLSSILIDDRILVDFSTTGPAALERFGADADAITDILLTHSHEDHFDVGALDALIRSRANPTRMRFWAHPEALKKASGLDALRLCPVEVNETFVVGDFRVTGLEANHIVEDSREKCLNYQFQTDARQFLYAVDGGWFLYTTWLRLREAQFDAIIWEATSGEMKGDYRVFGHNSIDMIRIMLQTFRKENVLKPNAQIILTHLARTLCAPHDELEKRLIPEGLIPAYDGLCVSL